MLELLGKDRTRCFIKMKPFDEPHYFDRHRLPKEVEDELNLAHHESVELSISLPFVTINCPLHPERTPV